MSTDKDKIGIIGFGNMGSAIGERLKGKFEIFVFDKDNNKVNNLRGISVSKNIEDLLNSADLVILAVKPQDFDGLLGQIKDFIGGKLLISIAAGITTKYIVSLLNNCRIIRVMPNLPARFGNGIICLCRSESATQADLEFVEELFRNLGQTLILSENMMDAATAISGSGPGYIYDWAQGKNIEEIRKYAKDTFIPSLARTAEIIGFTPSQANILAQGTAEGSIVALQKSKLVPSELKKQVASRGGTTEAALEVLHRGGSLEQAVRAALRRAGELSR